MNTAPSLNADFALEPSILAVEALSGNSLCALSTHQLHSVTNDVIVSTVRGRLLSYL